METWSGHVNHLNFGGHLPYLWKRLKLEWSNFAQLGYITFQHKDDKTTLKRSVVTERGHGHVTHFNFLPPNNISEMTEARVVAFYAPVDYSLLAPVHYSLRMTTTLEGAWPWSRDPFFKLAPIMSLEWVKLGTSNFVCWLIHRSTNALCMRTWYITPEREVFKVMWPLNFEK